MKVKMTKEAALVIILVLLALLSGCGTEADSNGSGAVNEPVALVNGIWFTCVDVDNQQVCNAGYDPAGFFNSGDVSISGNPMPKDYINFDIRTTLINNASVFVHMDVNINGCAAGELASGIINTVPGNEYYYTGLMWGYMCGLPGLNSMVLTLYNASHFNPAAYADKYSYPRDRALTNAVVRWNNKYN